MDKSRCAGAKEKETMPEWTVQVEGEPSALKWIADTLIDQDASIERIGGSQHVWQLRTDRLVGINDRDAALNVCRTLILRIRGMAGVHGLPSSDVRVSAVFQKHPDGSGTGTGVIPFQFEGLPTPTDKYSVSDLPEGDRNVETALRIFAERQLTWGELYKLLEIVQVDKGVNFPTTSGIMTESSLKNFKHTANSMAAVGDDARHGPKTGAPPSNPMPIAKARELIRGLLKNWLAEKMQNTKTVAPK